MKITLENAGPVKTKMNMIPIYEITTLVIIVIIIEIIFLVLVLRKRKKSDSNYGNTSVSSSFF